MLNLFSGLLIGFLLVAGFPSVAKDDSIEKIGLGYCEEEDYPFLIQEYVSGRVEIIIPQLNGPFLVDVEGEIFVSLPGGIKRYSNFEAFAKEYPGVGCQAGALWLKKAKPAKGHTI